jgi:hypothetical protein
VGFWASRRGGLVIGLIALVASGLLSVLAGSSDNQILAVWSGVVSVFSGSFGGVVILAVIFADE